MDESMLAVKFASDAIIEGWGLPFGGPHNGKDLAGEFFSVKTDLALDWFGPGERPLLYHHGLDDDAGMSVVGRVSDYKAGDLGVWTQAQLDKSSMYFDAIKEMVAKGKLFFSSGSMQHLVEKKSSGELTRWPWVELSLTPTPCNLFAETSLAETTKRFEAAGIKAEVLEAHKAELSTDARKNLSDSQFAYIDKDGGQHLPINDSAHVKNAMSRFGQTKFESPAKKRGAAKKIMAKAKKLGIDVADDSAVAMAAKIVPPALLAHKALPDTPTAVDGDSPWSAPEGSYEDLACDLGVLVRAAFMPDDYGPYDYGYYAYVVATFPGYCVVCVEDDGESAFYEIAYDVGADMEPTLGEMRRVERVYQPVTMPETEEAPLAIQSVRLSAFAATVLERTKGVQERRSKEGRVLSEANTARLTAAADSLDQAVKALRDLTTSTEPQPAKAASVRRESVEAAEAAMRDLDILTAWAAVEAA